MRVYREGSFSLSLISLTPTPPLSLSKREEEEEERGEEKEGKGGKRRGEEEDPHHHHHLLLPLTIRASLAR